MALFLVQLDDFDPDIVGQILACTEGDSTAAHDENLFHFRIVFAGMKPYILNVGTSCREKENVARLDVVTTPRNDGVVLSFDRHDVIEFLFAE